MPPNLLEIAISVVPRTRLWMFSSVMSGVRAGEHLRQRLREALDRLGDRHDVVAHAQRLGAVGRIRAGSRWRCSGRAASRSARARGPSASAASAATSARVDAAGQAEDHARESRSFDVVAQAQHAGVIGGGLALLERHASARPAQPSRRAVRPLRQRDASSQAGSCTARLPSALSTNEAPSNTSSSWPPIWLR